MTCIVGGHDALHCRTYSRVFGEAETALTLRIDVFLHDEMIEISSGEIRDIHWSGAHGDGEGNGRESYSADRLDRKPGCCSEFGAGYFRREGADIRFKNLLTVKGGQYDQ